MENKKKINCIALIPDYLLKLFHKSMKISAKKIVMIFLKKAKIVISKSPHGILLPYLQYALVINFLTLTFLMA